MGLAACAHWRSMRRFPAWISSARWPANGRCSANLYPICANTVRSHFALSKKTRSGRQRPWRAGRAAARVKLRTLEGLGGKHFLLVYLSAAYPDKASEFYVTLEQKLDAAGMKETPLVLLMDDVPERVQRFRETFKIAVPLYPDPDRRIGRSLGICRQGQPVMPTGFVMDHNMKIMQVHRHVEPEKLAAIMVNDLALEISQFHARYPQAKTILRAAPALIVPSVLTPELCAKCIRAFKCESKTGRKCIGTDFNCAVVNIRDTKL
ncbi:MAG: hypothetical protein EBV03_01750 [Proteobacteria bacterium]|nr:hypothetical protein [Pseudomonadota bacterium]